MVRKKSIKFFDSIKNLRISLIIALAIALVSFSFLIYAVLGGGTLIGHAMSSG
ncbi:hypothetical protein HN385_03150 [archaeon]|jgi:hypothetical protein|nr:hypothetical protein [archaeon]MBT3450814.1 hypothetical protein [archaeon]MBT6868477.1 hypothetical protein [archaeon]MBT7193576.1 hypothetical protein [archaeon]MBT7381229.1 hypothetical protein [archaeon]